MPVNEGSWAHIAVSGIALSMLITTNGASDKVYGFLEVVAKTGRTETNGNAGAGDSEGRAWEEVHRTLSDSMKERLDPYRGDVKVQPHEMRGSFEECRFAARILDRQNIDGDVSRSTGMVTFDLHNTGITFQPVSVHYCIYAGLKAMSIWHLFLSPEILERAALLSDRF
jgi:hypothetical protein